MSVHRGAAKCAMTSMRERSRIGKSGALSHPIPVRIGHHCDLQAVATIWRALDATKTVRSDAKINTTINPH